MTDVVVFRRWKDTGDLVAIFPELSADEQGQNCLAHDEIGQQVAADYDQFIEDTTPVTERESGRFAHELTLLGYDLQPIGQASERHHERRRASARKS